MQLDQARIAIRERSWLDNLDLALQVIRAHGAAVFASSRQCRANCRYSSCLITGFISPIRKRVCLINQEPATRSPELGKSL